MSPGSLSPAGETTMAAQSFLRDHPDLHPFLLSSATPTGTTIGTGSYGSVEEVAIPGAVCAAKKIHYFFQDPRQMPREGIEKEANKFVRECQLMSTLRHPHIVQFLGVCFLPGSPMPALVMEKLVTSLHDVLDPQPPPRNKPFIPVSMKRSILHDVARGLSFLHSTTPEPIIHRDLSARNVLLNEGMVAKIADLGMARIVPDALRASTMTKAPGASIYMPPEALEDESRYDTTIDIFSLGVLAIFTLSQTFPKPLAAAYMDDESGRMVGRTELERRGNYTGNVRRQFRLGHPLIRMIWGCLKNRLKERPNIDQVCGWLEEARGEVGDGEFDVNKLSLTQQLHSRNTTISQQRQEIGRTQQEIRILKQQNSPQKELIDRQNVQIDVQMTQIESLEEQVRALRAGEATSSSSSVPVKKSLQWPLSLNWREGKDAPTDNLFKASAVVLNGMVYCGGNTIGNSSVIQYNPETGDWSELPEPDASGFAMTSLNNQLILVGNPRGEQCDVIRVWDSGSREWVQPYPPLPNGRDFSAALGYGKYLIVACGYNSNQGTVGYSYSHNNQVDVLDSSGGRWYSAQPVPVGGHGMSSTVVGDHWYISSFENWEDDEKHIFCVHLPTLISTATSTRSTKQQIWHELPTPPVKRLTLLNLQRHLLLVGDECKDIHRYNTNQWMVCGQLPITMEHPCCAILPSGDLMLVGGFTEDIWDYSKRMWIAKI